MTVGWLKSPLRRPAPFGLGTWIAAPARFCAVDVRSTGGNGRRAAISGCGTRQATRTHERGRLRLVAQAKAGPARMAGCQTDRGFFDGALFSWASAWCNHAQRREIGNYFLVENG